MKERIAVLMGGRSSEREISLISGKAVSNALVSRGYQVFPIDVQGEIIENLKAKKIDIAFIALHGHFGEDGSIQRLLEQEGIPYTGSGIKASYRALNKIESKKIFQAKGISTPSFFVLNKKDGYKAILAKKRPFNFPWVIKPQAQGSSIGLSIITGSEQLDRAFKLAVSYGEEVLIEKYIAGKEITVGVLDEYPLPIVEIVPKREFYDYKAKYNQGLSEYLIPAPIDLEVYKRIQRIALAAHQGLGCEGMSRVDMRLDQENQPYVLEVNTIPGLTELSLLPKAAKAIGISFPNLCSILLKLAKAKGIKHETAAEEIRAVQTEISAFS